MKINKNYTIKLEAYIPCSLVYKISAEDEKDALKKLDKQKPSSVIPHLQRKKNIKAMIYEFGSSIVKLVKNF